MYAHPASIPQPPHTAGRPLQGPRARISPEQIPSPVEVAESDEETWNGKAYTTLPGNGHVPLSTTDCIVIDQGNSSPRFMRMTTWNIPSSSELSDACHIPLAAIIQPFADLQPGEDDVPVVDCDEAGPARCEMCRGYVNPWCSWISGGSKWKCNLCGNQNNVSSEYFSALDANQVRLDYYERPELAKGTVDFVVPSSYFAAWAAPRISSLYISPAPALEQSTRRQPKPMHILFAIDVSADAIQCGFTLAACIAIKCVFFGGEMDDNTRIEPCFPSVCKAGIVTFDSSVHFYDLSSHRDTPAMMVVPIVEDDELYCPHSEGLFVSPFESRNVMENLLDSIPSRFAPSPTSCALGAAFRGCLAALAQRGGQVIAFLSSQCQRGPGLVRVIPEESKLYGTDKEPQLFRPLDNSWQDLAEQYAEEGIGMTIFLGTGTNAYLDIASVGLLPSLSGGQLHHYPRFDPKRDGAPFRSQLRRVITRQTAYNVQARMNPTDLELGILHSDAAFSVCIEHSSRKVLDEREFAHLQCAVLYTSMDGRRMVRVMNLALQISALAGNVFRFADSDATVCHLAKEAMTSLPSCSMTDIRDRLTERCSSILLAYRRNCAAATAPSQLILPEAFKLLPVYTLGLHKHRSLRAHNVPTDLRNLYAQAILTSPVHKLLRSLYPRFMALHDLTDDIALPQKPSISEHHGYGKADNGSQRLQLPSLMRTSYNGMRADGIYLIDNEALCILWIGSQVKPEQLFDLFGTANIHDIDSRMGRMPTFPTRLSAQLQNILQHRLVERRGVHIKFFIARQNMDAAEIEMSDMLAEDQNCGAMSYIDYLCFVHKQINVALTNNTSVSNSQSYDMRGTDW